jgi:hypothetical protein
MSYIQNLFTSRDNNSVGNTNVGQQDRIWWNPDTNAFYYSDGVTPGGVLITNGSTGNGTVGGANTAVQFNNDSSFGGDPNFTFNSTTATLGIVNISAGNITGASTGNNLNIASGVDGNVNVTAGSGTWSFVNTGNLALAPTNVDVIAESGESATLRGTRKIVNGTTNSYAYSTVLNVGGTPTVAYTATGSFVRGVKLQVVVQGDAGLGEAFWEQFDISAVVTVGSTGVNFTVSNRVKNNATIGDTAVTANLVGGRITISVNLDASQTGGWASFDAVEFGRMSA